MKNKKTLAILLIFMMLASLITACGNSYDISDVESKTEYMENATENGDGEETKEQKDDVFGDDSASASWAMGHGAKNPNRDKDGTILPFEYKGGEFSMDYTINAAGKGKTVGMLLFLNGEPQQYKIKDKSETTDYYHSFLIQKEEEEMDFTISFIPNQGKKGETLNLTVVAIYNADYQPDMKKTTSFGFYHNALPELYQLTFRADAEKEENAYKNVVDLLMNSHISTKKITNQFLTEELPQRGYDGFTMEMLKENMCYLVDCDNQMLIDNIDITNKKKLHITYRMVGGENTNWKTTFFINHEPVSENGVFSYKAEMTKGNIWILDVEVDTSKLRKINTFYAVSVPINVEVGRGLMSAEKTSSVVFYR